MPQYSHAVSFDERERMSEGRGRSCVNSSISILIYDRVFEVEPLRLFDRERKRESSGNTYFPFVIAGGNKYKTISPINNTFVVLISFQLVMR